MKYLALLATIFLAACSPRNAPDINKSLNEEEFAGLETIGNSYESTALNYELDAKDGSLINFTSCSDVENTHKESVKEDQFPLFIMLVRNCQALNLFFKGQNSTTTFLPKMLSAEFISNLPAISIPNLGGEKPVESNETMEKAYPNLKTQEISPSVLQVQLDDMDINFTTLAKGDFNGDGIEDLLLRLDWKMTTAYGRGYDLLLIEADEKIMRITKRW